MNAFHIFPLIFILASSLSYRGWFSRTPIKVKKTILSVCNKSFQTFINKTNMTITRIFFFFVLQKARLARIRIAKASSGAAFVSKKKAAEARIAAQQSGLQLEDYKEEDIFELQHHHLLRCLEKTTVSSPRGIFCVLWQHAASFLRREILASFGPRCPSALKPFKSWR